MKPFLPALLLVAAGAAGWIYVSAEAPHSTRPDHRPAPATLASPAGPGEAVRNIAVEGMCCNGCAGKLHVAAMQVEGVREVAVDFDTGTVLVRAPEELDVGLLEEDCTALVSDFAKHIRTGLPYITLKAAVTLDGKIATRTGDSKWITGQEARTETHRMRNESDAILVGVGTVLADDPRLTVRHVEGRDPVRVVLDTDLRTPPTAAILDPGRTSSAGTWIFHAPDVDASRREALAAPGVELIPVSRDARGVDLREVLKALGERNVVRLLVEGGSHIHGAFLDLSLADSAAIFVAPRILGDPEAIPFATGSGVDSIGQAWQLVRTHVRALGSDWLVSGDFERTQ